jgi:hypothetical protein
MSQIFVPGSGGGGGGGTTSFVTDSGTATPAAGVIDINGANGAVVSAPGNSNQIVVTPASSVGTYIQVSAGVYVGPSSNTYISCDTSGGEVEILLPFAPPNYTIYTIKDRTGHCGTAPPLSHAIGIVPIIGVFIDGQIELDLDTAYNSVQIIYNGTNWEVF